MRETREDQEYTVLKILAEATAPVGSGLISEELRLAGFDISEATTGRLLRELDARQYTARVGYRGRVITPKGEARLQYLRAERERRFYGYELLNALKSHHKDQLIDILVARRVIEGELARLAAIHATDKDIEHMRKILATQRHLTEEGQPISQEDLQFHRLIAKVSKNRVLEAAMELIRQDAQLSPVFEHIRKEVKSAIYIDHYNILEAIAARSPERAREAMVQHIENLIADVNKYWEAATS